MEQQQSKIDINKEYLTVKEVAEHWGVRLEDIRYLGEEGKLTICIRRIPIEVAIEDMLGKKPFVEKPIKQKEIFKMLEAPQPLHPTDIYLLFSNPDKKIRITRFKTAPIMKIINVLSADIRAGFDDMIITSAEVKRFEFMKRTYVPTNIKNPLILLSDDFTNFELYGEEFKFGEKQAKALKYLYDRYYAGSPWIHGKILLRVAGSESLRVSNLFNRHPTWRRAVISNGRGFYRINLPFSESAPLRHDENQLSLFDNL